MRADQYAELFLMFEDAAIQAESLGTYAGAVDAECIRKNAEGIIQGMAIVELQDPGYLDRAIRMMRETA